MNSKHCAGCPLIDILNNIEKNKRVLKELKKERKQPDFKDGKFVQYNLFMN